GAASAVIQRKMYTVDTLCLAVPPQVTAAFKVRVEVLQAELAKVEESAAKAYISIPISPRILFVAAHNHDMADALRAAQPTEVVRKNNQRVIEQARKFVWGCTNSQLTFVQKHFGKLPDRELLTNQQRQEAIEAPRAREK